MLSLPNIKTHFKHVCLNCEFTRGFIIGVMGATVMTMIFVESLWKWEAGMLHVARPNVYCLEYYQCLSSSKSFKTVFQKIELLFYFL